MSTADRQLPITIEIAPDGIHIHVAYTGTLAGIPAALERLQAAGLVDMVAAHRSAAPAAGQAQLGQAQRKPGAPRITPAYTDDGTACCPVHNRPLSAGRFGPYCSARAGAGETANDKGYCALRFAE